MISIFRGADTAVSTPPMWDFPSFKKSVGFPEKQHIGKRPVVRAHGWVEHSGRLSVERIVFSIWGSANRTGLGD